MDAQTLIAAVCRDALEGQQTDDPKRKVTLATLRKVADRALEAYQKAPYPGRAVLPWVEERVSAFMKAAAGDGAHAIDKDLLPLGHPARPKSTLDPWAELLSAEERFSALQKSVLEAVTRAGVRKVEDQELVSINRRLSHLYAQHFEGSSHTVAPSGIERDRLVKAAALVHEELERRALFSPEEPLPREVHQHLYEEARKIREEPEVLVYEGEITQHPSGVRLQLGKHLDVVMNHQRSPLSLQPGGRQALDKTAARFSPDGSFVHVPFREPHEAPYEKAFALEEGVTIGKFAYTLGAETEAFTEFFCTGALSGVLVVGKESLLLRKSLVPYVLTAQAVETGYMPPDGVSALPPSLEWDVPPEMRYWKTACGQDPKAIRDLLVRQHLFTEDSVRLVDDLPRLTYEKRFVAAGHDAAPSVFAELAFDALPEAELFKRYANGSLAQAMGSAEQLAKGGAPAGGDVLLAFDDAKAAVAALTAYKQQLIEAERMLVSAPDAPETREEMKAFGRVFALDDVPGRIGVASHPLPREVTYLDDAVIAVPEQALKGSVSLLSKSASEDEQFVLGVVLEPDVVDAQQDTYSADEVRKTAHLFMAKYQNAGLMHKSLINDSVRIVESYLAPCDCEIGGEPVKKGTWLLAMIVEDAKLWTAVKDGTLTGFSIGGSAIRTPES